MINFILYSFLGWLIQSVYLSFRTRSPVNAGFLFLPFCPVYGVCMTFLITFVYPHILQSLPLWLLFLACFIAAAVTEYYTSLIFDLMFDVLLWDFNHYSFNLNGRTAVTWAVFWGAASSLTLVAVHPMINKLTLPEWTLEVSYILLIAMIIDFMFSTSVTRILKCRLAEMTELREKFNYYLKHSNVCDGLEKTPDIGDDSLIELAQRKGTMIFSYSELPAERLAATLALIKTRHKKLCRPMFFERRLINAFPLLKVYEQSESLRDIRGS